MVNYYWNTETFDIDTIHDLRSIYKELVEEDDNMVYDMSFPQFLENTLTRNNGTMVEIPESDIRVDYEIDYFDDEDSSGEYWTEFSTDREFYKWWKDLLEEEEDGNIRILDLSFS